MLQRDSREVSFPFSVSGRRGSTCPGVSRPRYVPPSGFLDLLAVCSPRRLPALFHAGNTPGVSPFRAFPFRRPVVLSDPVLSCRYPLSCATCYAPASLPGVPARLPGSVRSGAVPARGRSRFPVPGGSLPLPEGAGELPPTPVVSTGQAADLASQQGLAAGMQPQTAEGGPTSEGYPLRKSVPRSRGYYARDGADALLGVLPSGALPLAEMDPLSGLLPSCPCLRRKAGELYLRRGVDFKVLLVGEPGICPSQDSEVSRVWAAGSSGVSDLVAGAASSEASRPGIMVSPRRLGVAPRSPLWVV
jgi:hypothetical protein